MGLFGFVARQAYYSYAREQRAQQREANRALGLRSDASSRTYQAALRAQQAQQRAACKAAQPAIDRELLAQDRARQQQREQRKALGLSRKQWNARVAEARAAQPPIGIALAEQRTAEWNAQRAARERGEILRRIANPNG